MAFVRDFAEGSIPRRAGTSGFRSFHETNSRLCRIIPQGLREAWDDAGLNQRLRKHRIDGFREALEAIVGRAKGSRFIAD